MRKNIILIGYRCTGKTSVGKKISERLKMPFYDTDDLVKRETGRSVAKIVAEKGWPFFREKERAAIAGISDVQGCIIATGGGAVLDRANVQVLKRNGVFVWLKAEVDAIAARMAGSQGLERPPLSGRDSSGEITGVLRQRLPAYERLADFSVDTSAVEVDRVAGAICDWFERFECDAKDGVSS